MKRPISAIVAAILVTGLALAGVGCSGPSEAGEHNRRGVELLDAGKWEEAIAELDLAIQLEPDNAIAYSNRAYGYSSLGQHEQARVDSDKAIQLDPNEVAAYINRGIAYSNLGQPEETRGR